MASGGEERIVEGWNQLTGIAAHAAHAHVRVATVLLGTAVNHLGLSAEEVIQLTLEEVRKNS